MLDWTELNWLDLVENIVSEITETVVVVNSCSQFIAAHSHTVVASQE